MRPRSNRLERQVRKCVRPSDAYLRGIERRIAAGLMFDVASVASMFIRRWDAAVMGKVPDTVPDTRSNQVGIFPRDLYRMQQTWEELSYDPVADIPIGFDGKIATI